MDYGRNKKIHGFSKKSHNCNPCAQHSNTYPRGLKLKREWGEPVKGSPLTLPPSLRWVGVQTTKPVGNHKKTRPPKGGLVFLELSLERLETNSGFARPGGASKPGATVRGTVAFVRGEPSQEATAGADKTVKKRTFAACGSANNKTCGQSQTNKTTLGVVLFFGMYREPRRSPSCQPSPARCRGRDRPYRPSGVGRQGVFRAYRAMG